MGIKCMRSCGFTLVWGRIFCRRETLSKSPFREQPEQPEQGTHQPINIVICQFQGSLILPTQTRGTFFWREIPQNHLIECNDPWRKAKLQKTLKNFWTIESCCILRCFTHRFSIKHAVFNLISNKYIQDFFTYSYSSSKNSKVLTTKNPTNGCVSYLSNQCFVVKSSHTGCFFHVG